MLDTLIDFIKFIINNKLYNHYFNLFLIVNYKAIILMSTYILE